MSGLAELRCELLVQFADEVDDGGVWEQQAVTSLATVALPERRADLRKLFKHQPGVCDVDDTSICNDAW